MTRSIIRLSSARPQTAFELLTKLARAMPPPFITRRVLDADWRLNVWSKTVMTATRESALLGDLMGYDRTSNILSAGKPFATKKRCA